MQRKSSDEGTLLLDVWFVMKLTERLLDDALRPVGITADEFGLYSLVYSFGPMTQSQIARSTGMALTTVAGGLRRLTARGHLRETPNPDDARSRLIELTESGIEATFAGAQVVSALVPRLMATLRSGEATVRAGLADLDQGLRQLTGAPPRPYAGVEEGGGRAVAYDGDPLTTAQLAEVRRHIDWIRFRDGA